MPSRRRTSAFSSSRRATCESRRGRLLAHGGRADRGRLGGGGAGRGRGTARGRAGGARGAAFLAHPRRLAARLPGPGAAIPRPAAGEPARVHEHVRRRARAVPRSAAAAARTRGGASAPATRGGDRDSVRALGPRPPDRQQPVRLRASRRDRAGRAREPGAARADHRRSPPTPRASTPPRCTGASARRSPRDRPPAEPAAPLRGARRDRPRRRPGQPPARLHVPGGGVPVPAHPRRRPERASCSRGCCRRSRPPSRGRRAGRRRRSTSRSPRPGSRRSGCRWTRSPPCSARAWRRALRGSATAGRARPSAGSPASAPARRTRS